MFRLPEPAFRRKALVSAMMCATFPALAVAQENNPATLQVLGVDGLELGSQIRWQSEISQEQGVATTGPNAGTTIVTEQDAYAVLDLMARYDFARNWNATLNVNNVTDEKYIESLKKFGTSAQGFYGEPANASLTVSWVY
ncbi:MAG: TonB-dependent receptor [Marinobacter sp.]|uniref:TonB-dependent receptor domain-containing protein n=1 Tax=Marinobacter sp. TaxID=50741 RepID=UPI00396E1FE0